ncbi:transcriptional regulator [Acinetobacter ursingii]|uniref:transcriptional regulator n=1 Tax=Acinetobacter ursingii TaxID=108980 RepID=UPI00124FA3D0|nr:Cro/CI family transcriptional regulator [Acinetobacter ursingii]
MTSPEEAFEKAVAFAGSPAALARGIGITPWALSKWNISKIPSERCEQIQDFTKNLVLAEELRPDINWDYLRSLKTKKVTA